MPSGIYDRNKSKYNSGLFKKGDKNWLKRKSIKGELHPNWKGESVGYYALHHWIKREFGVPFKCENGFCIYPRKTISRGILLKPKRFEWANISGKYLRDRNDWIMLCVSCHRKYDRTKNK